MLGAYKNIVGFVIIIMLAAGSLSAAPAQIDRLGLSHEGDFTVLTIEGNSQMRVAHQSVEAREGKPFRIVIDCLAARHSLPKKAFNKLPASNITSIRTAQYSVHPEEVVRVVLDLKEESVYRVDTKGNAIKVYITDPKTKTFAEWSTPRATGFVAKTNPKEKTAPEVKKTTVSKNTAATNLIAKTNPKEKTVPEVKKTTVSKVSKNTVPEVKKTTVSKVSKNTVTTKAVPQKPIPTVRNNSQKFTYTYYDEAPKDSKPIPIQQKQNLKLAQAPNNAKADSKAAENKTQTARPKPVLQNKNLANDTVNRALAFAAATDVREEKPTLPAPGDVPKTTGLPNTDTHKKNSDKNVLQPTDDLLATVVVNPKPTKAKEVSVKNTPSAETNNKKSNTVTASVENKNSSQINNRPIPVQDKQKSEPAMTKQSEPIAQKESDEKDRSRFRRNEARSIKMKQTQVVQFPQRMVIKYKRTGGRDPFATLIDVGRPKTGSTDLSRIPNIESLRLVGVLEARPDGKDAALLEDMDGIGYILKTGDKVRNGYVAEIDKRAIYFRINEYGWGRTITKKLDK